MLLHDDANRLLVPAWKALHNFLFVFLKLGKGVGDSRLTGAARRAPNQTINVASGATPEPGFFRVDLTATIALTTEDKSEPFT
ncbi:Uncharacterized protein TCM_042454 [Theobroma cacao]|uniref:Uncharacterized protein n=1 Tax=Theobroma cacao TaxID=3641 RepID=A0A061FK74_THECC|nr:Uncharacterized protein TCM_042454 [Theobroma cacao]